MTFKALDKLCAFFLTIMVIGAAGLVFGMFAFMAVAAQSPKSTPAPVAFDPKLTDEEYKKLEPLAIQFNAKQQTFQQALNKLYEFDTSDESRAGFALNAIGNLKAARDLMAAADKAFTEALDIVRATHNCKKCGLDWQKKILVQPPEEVK